MVCVVTFACAGGPAYAATDPLLSGYSGPGGGEQVVIGSSVLPAKTGNGSIRSTAAPTPPGQAPSEPAQSGSGSSGATPREDQQPTAAAPTEAQAQPAVAAEPSYPNTVSSASSVPLSRRDFALLVVVAFAVGMIAFAATRLSRAAV